MPASPPKGRASSGNFSTIARKTISAPEPTAISTKNSPPLPPISKTAPMQLQFRDPQSGELVRREVTWVNVVEVLYQHLAFSDSAMLVPRFIAELHDVARGRLSLNDDEGGPASSAARWTTSSIRWRWGSISRSSVARITRSPMRRVSPPRCRKTRSSSPERIRSGCIASTAPSGMRVPAPDGFSAPLHSEIPTLILSGDADTLTPHVMAQGIASHLPNGQLVSFRGIGHDVHSSLLCGRSLVANFLDAPDKPVDQSCVGDIRPRFE